MSMMLLCARDFLHVILLFGLVSLSSALMYLQFGASDVSMTEVALNSAVSTCILLKFSQLLPKNLNLISCQQDQKTTLDLSKISFVISSIVCAILFVCLCICLNNLEPYQSHASNVQQQVNLYYINNTALDIGIDSMVAAILASYRGYDTLNETLVIFIACASSFLLLHIPRASVSDRSECLPNNDLNEYYRKKLTLAMPLLIIFILFLQFAGEASPGGGFQAGAMSCGYIMLFSLIRGRVCQKLQNDAEAKLVLISALGVIIYLLVGALDLLRHPFLSYRALDAIGGQAAGIMLIELGVWFTVCFSLYLIFITYARCAPLVFEGLVSENGERVPEAKP
nr:MnhB domain-containing protein [Candidatus Sarmatiella mevalonica]